jgi:kynurenine formamidase
MNALASLIEGLADGSIHVIDLTQPLSEETPLIRLPEPFVNTPGWKLRELSRYDDRGPAWYWNAFEGGEHVGTHFDAPIHWATGQDKDDVSQVHVRNLVGPAVVIDKSADCAADPDFLLTVDHVMAFEKEHGPLPEGGWLLYRTGWDARAHDQKAFLNADDAGPHTPGIEGECSRWLAQESPIVGIGVETVGTDAGAAHSFDPPFPCHSYMLGAGKYGLTQLANLAEVPPTGAVILVAPLKIVGGSGSPCRALAFVPAR